MKHQWGVISKILNKEQQDVISKIMEDVIFENLPSGYQLLEMLKRSYEAGKKQRS